MPETYWLPLDVDVPVKADHLHAAFSRWFDADAADEDPRRVPHSALAKPYSFSMVGENGGVVGLAVSVLSDGARGLFLESASRRPPVKLGAQLVRPGRARRIAAASWSELSHVKSATTWDVEFQTPTVFRTSGRPSLLPTPSVALRAPLEAWSAWSGLQLPGHDTLASVRTVRVEDVQLSTVPVTVGRAVVKGVVGRVRYACDDSEASRAVSVLLAVAQFSGIGSYTRRGFGTVSVSAPDVRASVRSGSGRRPPGRREVPALHGVAMEA